MRKAYLLVYFPFCKATFLQSRKQLFTDQLVFGNSFLKVSTILIH